MTDNANQLLDAKVELTKALVAVAQLASWISYSAAIMMASFDVYEGNPVDEEDESSTRSSQLSEMRMQLAGLRRDIERVSKAEETVLTAIRLRLPSAEVAKSEGSRSGKWAPLVRALTSGCQSSVDMGANRVVPLRPPLRGLIDKRQPVSFAVDDDVDF